MPRKTKAQAIALPEPGNEDKPEVSQELVELRAAMNAFHDRWTARGKKLVSYECPSCHQTIQRTQPNPEDVQDKGYWDSLTRCCLCGEVHFTMVWPDGRIEVDPDLDRAIT